MTPGDQEALFNTGSNTILNILNLIVISLGYGGLVLMTCISLHTLRIALFICCIVMLLSFTLYFLYDSVSILAYTFEDFVGYTDVATVVWLEIGFVTAKVLILMGDVIVVWRAWVLLPGNLSGKVLLTVLMLANIGLNIADCVEDYVSVSQVAIGIVPALDWISYAASLAINISSTLFIVWKFW
ncbi:hypothetical protein GYMLUDRAFT_252092 [Collybiopsis luxurians FD-317 M1]|uniref:Uncharacterized protein n=1 Tax=Collybiopsis luxurians FD-317 M1 TaxID=944289 RepID=A0A0D0BAR9_9AGAR|nr:hypothetical protein GYMLUDRAFT_252092 [Collybiopsis luxurians FD-317 M1]